MLKSEQQIKGMTKIDTPIFRLEMKAGGSICLGQAIPGARVNRETGESVSIESYITAITPYIEADGTLWFALAISDGPFGVIARLAGSEVGVVHYPSLSDGNEVVVDEREAGVESDDNTIVN